MSAPTHSPEVVAVALVAAARAMGRDPLGLAKASTAGRAFVAPAICALAKAGHGKLTALCYLLEVRLSTVLTARKRASAAFLAAEAAALAAIKAISAPVSAPGAAEPRRAPAPPRLELKEEAWTRVEMPAPRPFDPASLGQRPVKPQPLPRLEPADPRPEALMDAERDRAFVSRLQEDGGMPAAGMTPSGRGWVSADGQPWRGPAKPSVQRGARR